MELPSMHGPRAPYMLPFKLSLWTQCASLRTPRMCRASLARSPLDRACPRAPAPAHMLPTPLNPQCSLFSTCS